MNNFNFNPFLYTFFNILKWSQFELKNENSHLEILKQDISVS